MKDIFSRSFHFVATAILVATITISTLAQSDNAALQEAARLHPQVITLFKQNKFDEALPLAKKVVAIREKELKDNDHLLAVSYFNLASIYREKMNYDEAGKYFRRSLSVEEKRVGKDHPDLADTILNLAWVSHALNNPTEAEFLFKRLISIREKQYGTEHPEVASSLTNLAIFLEKIGQPGKSIPIFQRALNIHEKAFGENSSQTLKSVEEYACALMQNKEGTEAQALWKRARSIEHELNPKQNYLPGEVLVGKATNKVQPQYSRAALAMKLSGVVLVKVHINESGKVIEATRLCGPDLLAPESEEAARKWTFSPTLVGGQPVKVFGILTFNFSIR